MATPQRPQRESASMLKVRRMYMEIKQRKKYPSLNGEFPY